MLSRSPLSPLARSDPTLGSGLLNRGRSPPRAVLRWLQLGGSTFCYRYTQPPCSFFHFFTHTAKPNITLCSHESQANAASDECTADSLAHGLACYATCSAGSVTSDGWTTCVIDGFGGQDQFDAIHYYTYISGKGTEGGRLEVRISRIERQADRPPSNMRRCDVRL